MRRVTLLLLVGWLGCLPVFAQEKVVQSFDGAGPLTTPAFQVQAKWEVRWDSADVLSITLLAPDGSIVAGTSASAKGSFYQPKGGSYSLQISHVAAGSTTPWHVSVAEIGSAPAPSETSNITNYIPPSAVPTPSTTNIAASANPPGTTAPSTNAAPAVPTSASLTADQARAIVLVKGDAGEGTGFLVKTPDGPAVVTNIHVIFGNPNVKITATSGEEIKVLGLKGASDRDLAMFLIQDNHYNYLDFAPNVATTVQTGDDVITPGNSEGGEVMLNTPGTVLGLGPQWIEVSNPFYHGNSGGPVIHTKSGKVVGVVLGAMKVAPTDDLDRASLANKDSAITGTMRYFGVRPDTVPQWEVYDWPRFLNESSFLKNFHEQSRCLDSLMNGAAYEKAHLASMDENGHPDSRYYLHNDKIVTVHDNFRKQAADADDSQRLDADRELAMDLESIADADMTAIQNPANFYSYDRLRATTEIKYRKALREEIDKFDGKIIDMGH